MKTVMRFAKYILLTYCITGLVYSAGGYIHRSIIGKQEVFSPLIGIPSDMISWPWMVYADLKHIGVGLQDVLALISLLLCIVLFVRKELNLNKSMENDDKRPIK